MDIGNDIFLDSLCLSIYSQTPETKLLITTTLDIYDDNYETLKWMTEPIIRLYIDIIRSIVANELDLSIEADVSTLFMKLSHNLAVTNNPNILKNIKIVIDNRSNVQPNKIEILKRRIKHWIIWFKSTQLTKAMFGKLQKVTVTRDLDTQDMLLDEVLTKAREISLSHQVMAGTVGSALDFIDMSDKVSVKAALAKSKYVKEQGNVFKTGLQGLNKMFYPNDGPERGEFICFAACSHGYKSGILMSMARWLVTHNTPPPTSGRPVIVFISLENEIYKNLNQWFKEMYINATFSTPDHMSDEEIIDYITNMYHKNGYDLLVYRKIGELFGFNEYVALIEELESKGYTIIASIIDYITLMKTNDKSPDNPAKRLQMLASNLGQYNKHKLITTITGLQLSSEAEYIASSGISYIVKRFGAGHLADCKGLKRELDFLAYMHIEVDSNKRSYLTFKWDKHRYCDPPPIEYKTPAFRFHETYGIMDDLGREDTVIHDIYDDPATIEIKPNDKIGDF